MASHGNGRVVCNACTVYTPSPSFRSVVRARTRPEGVIRSSHRADRPASSSTRSTSIASSDARTSDTAKRALTPAPSRCPSNDGVPAHPDAAVVTTPRRTVWSSPPEIRCSRDAVASETSVSRGASPRSSPQCTIAGTEPGCRLTTTLVPPERRWTTVSSVGMRRIVPVWQGVGTCTHSSRRRDGKISPSP